MVTMTPESLHEGPPAAAAEAEKRLRSATFLLSAARLDQLPGDGRREVAFVGRSNAGKSSALNALTGRRALARVSKTPGRTQLLNLFDLADGGRLVDLPGYGYARVPEAQRRSWQALAGGYKVKDATAFALARETSLPIIVFSIAEPGSIGAVLSGKGRGTVVAG